jgi:hypothetical protein
MSIPTSEFRIRAATPDEIAEFQSQYDHDAPTVLEMDLAERGQEILAMGGFASKHGRVWAVLTVMDGAERYGVRLVRRVLQRLRAHGETVYVQCDGDYAERLLKLLGFMPTNEVTVDADGQTQLRIWQWVGQNG